MSAAIQEVKIKTNIFKNKNQSYHKILFKMLMRIQIKIKVKMRI